MKMNTICVKKDELLKIIMNNKEKHIKEYNEAMRGYRIGVVEALENLIDDAAEFELIINRSLKDAQSGGELKTDWKLDTFNQFNDLSQPESHEKDYTIAIGMIELDISDEVELTKNEYQQFVENEWVWSDTFKLQVSGNLGIGTSAPRRIIDSISNYGFN